MNRQPPSSRINRDSPSPSWAGKKWAEGGWGGGGRWGGRRGGGGAEGTLPDILTAQSLTYLRLNKCSKPCTFDCSLLLQKRSFNIVPFCFLAWPYGYG